MPIISYDSGFIRYFGGLNRSLEQVTIELKQFIQYRLLGTPEYRPLLGEAAIFELQDIVRRLNEQQLLTSSDVSELYGLSDRIDAINGSSYSRPSWFTPSYLSPASTTSLPFLSGLFQRRQSLIGLGRLVFGGYAFPGVRANTGTFVNVVRPAMDPEVVAAQRLYGEQPGGSGDLGPIL